MAAKAVRSQFALVNIEVAGKAVRRLLAELQPLVASDASDAGVLPREREACVIMIE